MRIQIVFTLFVGLSGGLIGKKLKLPAPFMIGTMIAVALVSMMTGQMYVPNELKLVAQVIAGAYIGQQITKEDLLHLPKLWQPISILLLLFTLNMILMGMIFHYFFNLDLVTAFLSALPGGIMDVSLMSLDMGAQSEIVATMQTTRLVGMLIILPNWIRLILFQIKQKSERTIGVNTQKKLKTKEAFGWRQNSLVLMGSAIGGIIGFMTHLPVGTLIFSLIVSTILKIKLKTKKLSPSIRYCAQICAGSIIGSSFTRDSLFYLMQLWIPAICLLVSYLIINILFSTIAYRKGMMDLRSALFASSPAGATDITLIVGDMGGDMTKIASIQFSRMLFTVIILPLIVRLIVLIING